MQRRNLTPQILSALRDTPVVYLQGPRQAGKSTLAQALRNDGYDAEYFTLDAAATLAAAQGDPDGFVGGLPERVILDEVQRVPELLRAIKRNVDAKRKPGRFLLTWPPARISRSPCTGSGVIHTLPCMQLKDRERRWRPNRSRRAFCPVGTPNNTNRH